jgi:predicted DNA-binding protein (MmcQ/YjbR family)
MTYDELVALCLSMPGAWPDEPWGDGVVAKVGTAPGKVFAFPGPGDPPGVALKLPPEECVELRAAYPGAVGEARYLSRKHWVQVRLDGSVAEDELVELLQTSHRLVVAALPKPQRPSPDHGQA